MKDNFCNIFIDYSAVTENPALPFSVAIDTEASRLVPGPGERQLFCYRVRGSGCGRDAEEDLIGLSFEMPARALKELLSVRASADGKAVDLDGGALVRRDAGLEFHIPLSRNGGQLTICFELARPCAVENCRVTVWGARGRGEGLFLCGPKYPL